jgi:hypothetical protein
VRLLQHVGEGGAVDGRNHEHVRTIGNHALDLRQLRRDVILGELQVRVVAGGLKNLDHVLAIGNPARGGLGRHGDAHLLDLVASRRFGSRCFSRWRFGRGCLSSRRSAAATGAQHKRRHQRQHNQKGPNLFLHCVFSFVD